MVESQSRRRFLQAALVGCGSLCCTGPMAVAAVTDEELGKLRQELSVEFQTRQVADRVALFRRLVAAYGRSVIDDVEQFTIEHTRGQLAAAELEHRDLAGVTAYLWDHLGAGFEFRCVENTPNRLAYEVTGCFLAAEYARHDARELGAAFNCAWDHGFCQGLNPKIRFTRTKTLMAGDPVCNHAYELSD